MAYIYLASPYTDKSKVVEHRRYLRVSEVTAQLLCRGIHVYSPIVHCHELAKAHRLPGTFTFWKDYNFAMLERASGFHILELEGWNESKGLCAETQYATSRALPITRHKYPLGIT